MEKDFLEVFLGLEVEKELKALLEDVKVTKIAVNPKKDRMRVYIQSIQWIQKKYIYALEKQIKKQFFASAQIQIKIIEKFTLTSQYTPKLFFEAYRSSMLDELRGHSILIYNTFRTAKIEFPEENKMKLVMQSSVLAKSHEEELISYIEKIFCERCAFSLIVEPEYEEAGESKIRKNSEIRIMQEAAHVIEQSSFGHVKDEAEEGTESEANQPDTTKEEKKEDIDIKMTAIGDIMCHNTQYNDAYLADSKTYDFSYVFTDIEKYINSADIAVGNLETTFAGKERGYSSYPRFNTPEQLATNLKKLGIDVVSTANNHCMDTNYSGLVSTLKYLDEAEIAHTGTNESEESQNKILIQDVKGIKIAFLSFTYGTNGISIPSDKKYAVNLIDDELIIKQLQLAKEQKPDLICVSMHWGEEYQTKPNSEQKRLANLLFENGVDIILGSHPHVLQPMEKKEITLEDGMTKECFVIYSLGNFMSGQVKEGTRDSIILNLDIKKSGETGKTTISKVDYIPIYMYKSTTGNTKRYKILDLEKKDFNNELSKIRKIMN